MENDYNSNSSIKPKINLYFSRYLNPLSVNVKNFFPFSSVISLTKPFSNNSFRYSEKLCDDKFEYLNRGVGFIELWCCLIIFKISYTTSRRSLLRLILSIWSPCNRLPQSLRSIQSEMQFVFQLGEIFSDLIGID